MFYSDAWFITKVQLKLKDVEVVEDGRRRFEIVTIICTGEELGPFALRETDLLEAVGHIDGLQTVVVAGR